MASHPDVKSSLGDSATIDALIQELIAKKNEVDSLKPNARQDLLATARKLVSAVETPLESALQLMWNEPTRLCATRAAIDLEVFPTLVADGGRPKSVEELAKPKGADPLLVHRLARSLASNAWIDEPEPGVYAPNGMTRVMSVAKYSDGIKFCYDSGGPAFVRMAEYLRKTNYQEPQNADDGPFQFAHDGKSCFGWLGEDPERLHTFHTYIGACREYQTFWSEEGFYPVKERLLEGLRTEGDSSALVDIGGSVGQALEFFLADVPEWNGRLVLQELESVVENAKSSGMNPRIEAVAHDFFEPQPIRGARAYYMRSILHDWPDDKCRQILTRLKDALDPGYSKILINENVLADKGAAWQHAALDLYMMGLASSKERSETDWHELVESVGLKITGIWSKGVGGESIIEVML